MAKRKLPNEGLELDYIISTYRTASDEWIDATYKKLGYASAHSFKSSMFKTLGIRREVPVVKPQLEESERIITPAPLIKIKPIKQEGRRGEGEEAHLQLISDAHTGLLTPSYNIAVFKERLARLRQAMIQLCLLHRKMRPIKKLVAPLLGDMGQGEQYGVQGFVEEFECGAVEQIYDVLVPEFSNFFINLLQVYQEIEIPVVDGNHGNIQRRSQTMSKRSNWDSVFYRALQQALSNYSRIKIIIPQPAGQWYQVIEVNGWHFLLAHGDQIISYQGVPFYGIERRGLRWKQSIGVNEPFDYMLTAHVHNPNFLWNAGIPTYVNGCFVTDSNFPLVRMGLKDVPTQWSLFVNKKHGVTASYRVNLELK